MAEENENKQTKMTLGARRVSSDEQRRPSSSSSWTAGAAAALRVLVASWWQMQWTGPPPRFPPEHSFESNACRETAQGIGNSPPRAAVRQLLCRQGPRLRLWQQCRRAASWLESRPAGALVGATRGQTATAPADETGTWPPGPACATHGKQGSVNTTCCAHHAARGTLTLRAVARHLGRVRRRRRGRRRRPRQQEVGARSGRHPRPPCWAPRPRPRRGRTTRERLPLLLRSWGRIVSARASGWATSQFTAKQLRHPSHRL